MSLNIVFVQPEIPPNTGNIARTCAATDTKLHLVKPLGFSIDDKHLKRAGLDYWPYVDLEIHESLKAFMEKYGHKRLWLATTRGGRYRPPPPLRTKTLYYSGERLRDFLQTSYPA